MVLAMQTTSHTLAHKIDLLAILPVLRRSRNAIVNRLLRVRNALQARVVAHEELLLSALRAAAVGRAESRTARLRAHLLACDAALAAVSVLVDQLDEWRAAAWGRDDGSDAFWGVQGGLVDVEAALVLLVVVGVPEDELAVRVPGWRVEGFAGVLSGGGKESVGGGEGV